MSEYGHKVQVWSADWDAAHARISALEAALREAMEWDWLTDPDSIPKEIYSRLSNMLLMDRFALETSAKQGKERDGVFDGYEETGADGG